MHYDCMRNFHFNAGCTLSIFANFIDTVGGGYLPTNLQTLSAPTRMLNSLVAIHVD